MEALVGLTLLVLAAVTGCGAAWLTVADLGKIPDSFPKRERVRRQRPVIVRSSMIFLLAGALATAGFRPFL